MFIMLRIISSGNSLNQCFVLLLLVTTCLYTISCDSDNGTSGGGGGSIIVAENAFPELSFVRPLDIQNAGDGSDRLFVVEQRGTIQVITPDDTAVLNTSELTTARAEASVFLDIQDRVLNDEGGEVGLLGLAFHPDFENNGYFYVNYTDGDPLRTVISRFSVSDGDSETADPESELVLLELEQPHPFHNGGQLFFGPFDGYLYTTLGDGGVHPGGDAQDLTNLFGTILRIDVDNPDEGLEYGIPPDNPFAGNMSGFRGEIYAYGLRNPWRASIDPLTGVLITADVGEGSREEINIVEPGANYGWPIMEGTLCFEPPSGCDMSGLELPIWEYGHSQGRSIIGGFVYRGSEIEQLQGEYIYGDFASGRIWALSLDGETVTDNEEIFRFADEETFIITSFGLDEEGEIYIAGISDGIIYKLEELFFLP
jgi:glucose/arabinose dehydrogenase